MAAVIQRVVALPIAHTEFLHSQPNEPEVWGEKAGAFIFPTHALADAVARKMREASQAARHESGQLVDCFVHARTLESSEFTVHMDPRRAAEVRRDPAEAYQ